MKGPGQPNYYCPSSVRHLPGSVYEFPFAISWRLVGKEESYCHFNTIKILPYIVKIFY